MFKMETLTGHERMSTQDLLLAIEAAVREGETEFEIAASGQHDIGGPLWHPEGKKLTFHVTNPGQRVGSMCLDNTEVIVDGPASADVGWLNAGGRITVRGDAGDTAGHCSAGGKIFIGGRAGTRTGSLMKHDPLYEEPELWILKNVGSFSFEFMGGGRAIVCGYDSEQFSSVLGERPCVGMVGGIVYVRGTVAESYPDDIRCLPLDESDIAFVAGGMDEFLEAIQKPELKAELTDWTQWKKLRPMTAEDQKPEGRPSVKEFRRDEWVQGGIFSDVAMDDFKVLNTVNNGLYRLRVPSWDNAKYAAPCEFSCPTGIPTQQRMNLIRQGRLEEAARLVLEYTPFPGCVCGTLCPNPCMEGCSRGSIDEPVQIGPLGLISANAEIEKPSVSTGKKIGIIGGGVAGLSAAWQLARKGHEVTVYDESSSIGGKMEQAIPRARLDHSILEKEIKRIEEMGVKLVPSFHVDKIKFEAIRNSNDAVIVATGGTRGMTLPWEGVELVTLGIDFMKTVNLGLKPRVGKKVLIIGAGNSGMDAAEDAYALGAEEVTLVNRGIPKAHPREIARIKALGAKIVHPFYTKKITPEGVYAEDGRFIEADQVIVCTGEAPVTDFLPDDPQIKRFKKDWLVPDENKMILPGVFAAGDLVKPGLLTDAIGDGRNVAHCVDQYLKGEEIRPLKKKAVMPQALLSKGYFDKCRHCDLPNAADDHARCISCGTCRDCHMCEQSCPEMAISRTVNADGSWEYSSDASRCIGCGICSAVCPCGIWTMQDNPEPIQMYRTYNKD